MKHPGLTLFRLSLLATCLLLGRPPLLAADDNDSSALADAPDAGLVDIPQPQPPAPPMLPAQRGQPTRSPTGHPDSDKLLEFLQQGAKQLLPPTPSPSNRPPGSSSQSPIPKN